MPFGFAAKNSASRRRFCTQYYDGLPQVEELITRKPRESRYAKQRRRCARWFEDGLSGVEFTPEELNTR